MIGPLISAIIAAIFMLIYNEFLADDTDELIMYAVMYITLQIWLAKKEKK